MSSKVLDNVGMEVVWRFWAVLSAGITTYSYLGHSVQCFTLDIFMT
jgi:hypothetical protein